MPVLTLDLLRQLPQLLLLAESKAGLCAISLQLSANLGTSMRAGIVEWQRDEGSQEFIKFRMFAGWV